LSPLQHPPFPPLPPHPLTSSPPPPPPPPNRSASYKNKENINLEKVPTYKQHDSDAGSTQVQIARLSARIEQISTHLRINRKDYSSKRGLEAVLSQRKRLLRYLYRTDRSGYDKLISELGIRSVIAGDSHKAAQRLATAAAAQ